MVNRRGTELTRDDHEVNRRKNEAEKQRKRLYVLLGSNGITQKYHDGFGLTPFSLVDSYLNRSRRCF